LLFEKKLIKEDEPGDIGIFRLGELFEIVGKVLHGSDVSHTDNRFTFILNLFNEAFGDMLLVAELREQFSFASYV